MLVTTRTAEIIEFLQVLEVCLDHRQAHSKRCFVLLNFVNTMLPKNSAGDDTQPSTTHFLIKYFVKTWIIELLSMVKATILFLHLVLLLFHWIVILSSKTVLPFHFEHQTLLPVYAEAIALSGKSIASLG